MRNICLAIILLVLSASFCYCQDQPLTLTIKSDKQAYGVGEPIYIKYSLKNNSSQSIRILAYGGKFGFQWGNPFSIKDSDGNIVKYTGIMKLMPAPTEKDYIIMQSGSILEDIYRLDLSYDMSKPSTYLIECNKWQLDLISDVAFTSNTIQIEVKGEGKNPSSPLNETSCIQEGPSNNNLELKNGYEHGPAEIGASIAFNLANGFIQRQQDLRRFLITEPSVGGMDGVYDVHYKLLTKSEENEAIIRVDIRNKRCKRIK